MPCAAAPALALNDADRRKLLQLTSLRSAPQTAVLRAKIILGAADGVANKALARQLATTLPTLLLRRSRYESDGLMGILADRPRSGRPIQWVANANTITRKVRKYKRTLETGH